MSGLKMTRFPIVMKIWAGTEPHDFEYISRSIPSLLRSNLPKGTEVLLFDDCSTDPRIKPFLREIENNDPRVRVFMNDINKGPNLGQADAYSFVESEYPDAPFFIQVDDDVIYNPQWFNKLLEAKKEVEKIRMNGIYTALNVPWRVPFARLSIHGSTYLLKWKQDASNWLIPRDVYNQIGPFVDEGIAYDTVYSHWLRLNGYPTICVKPSYVQNIGTFGAYSKDNNLKAHDFIGEKENGVSLAILRRLSVGKWARSFLKILPRHGNMNIVAPIRWGSEWVYEGVGKDGESVAFFLIDPAISLGWSSSEVANRVREILNHQSLSPVGVRKLRYNLRQSPIAVECSWTFLPNLRERRKYPHLYPLIDPLELLEAMVRDLVPLHKAGIVHNKIRQDNVYIREDRTSFHLAWYGTEPPPRRNLLSDKEWVIHTLGGAVDKRASEKIRERFATFYLETVAPEVMKGGQATLQSDVFSMGAVVFLFLMDKEIETFAQLQRLREEWAMGKVSLPGYDNWKNLRGILGRCVSLNPSQRFKSALELRKALVQVAH